MYMLILFDHAIVTSTACASSVSPSSYRNTILNQLARISSLDCFLKFIYFIYMYNILLLPLH